MLRVYTASKLAKGKIWMELCEKHSHLIFHARWLKHHRLGTPDGPEHAPEFWLQDEADVRDADVVLVWATEGEHLRGALIEAGMAIAYGVPVIVIGDHPDYGTWQYHPGVAKAKDIEQVMLQLLDMSPRYTSRPHYRSK